MGILDFSPPPPIWNLLDPCLFQKMNGFMWRWNRGVAEREANDTVLNASSSSSVGESSSAKWWWKYRPRMLRDQPAWEQREAVVPPSKTDFCHLIRRRSHWGEHKKEKGKDKSGVVLLTSSNKNERCDVRRRRVYMGR
nr:hypothetical protein Iba_chr01fCG7710 [Ipomoea batatas]